MNWSCVLYGDRKIEFSYILKKRKTMEIAVNPDSSVFVKAPLNTVKDKIDAKVLNKASWIVDQMRYFEEFQPASSTRQWVNGESHLYLGRRYRLKIIESGENDVVLKNGMFNIYTEDTTDRKKVRKMLHKWYGKKAEFHLRKRFEDNWEVFKKNHKEKPVMKIRKMEKSWGRVSANKILNLNIELIKVPTLCIDYVIIHELCHLVHFNHDKNFYKLLESIISDWKLRKHRLELSLV